MLRSDTIIEFLRETREDKKATVVLVGLMSDSLHDATTRINELIPLMKDMEYKSRRKHGNRINTNRLKIDNDIAKRIIDIAEDVLPWLEQLAKLEGESEEDWLLGLA